MKREKKLWIIFGLIVLVGMYIFFTRVHPLIIYDADDWTYIAYYRAFIPIFGSWNPAKVLPETLMPFCGTIAVYVINPLINNYVESMMIITAFMVSIAIVIYLYTFINFIIKRYELSMTIGILIGFVFFLLHFLLFIVKDSNNDYLFLTHNVNCYYNYLIPNLLNFSLVFYFLSNDKFDFSIFFPKNLKYGVMILIIYVAIFSNLYANIILGVYAGSEILVAFINERKKIKFIDFVRKYFLLFMIIISWIISAIFELSGGRAADLHETGFINKLIESIGNLKYMLFNGVSRSLLIIFLIVIIFFCLLFFKNKDKDKDKNVYTKFILYIVIVTMYYLLLCAKVKPTYILSAEKIYGLYVYCLSFVFLCFAYIVKKYPKLVILFPFVICYLIVDVNGNIKNLKESNTSNISPYICEEVNKDIISQIVKADKAGLLSMKLYVPVSDRDDNWPHAFYFGERISNTLYKHGIVKNKIEIKIIPDNNKNEKYKIEIK